MRAIPNVLHLAGGRRRRAPRAAARRGGSVALVGAGPGDPELLTLKAARLLAEAEVVVHDRLVPAAILDCADPRAERVYVGKAPGAHARTQDGINALLAELALAGRRVVRLKGGDPFVFGRGGEEQAYLEARGIEVTVVPGITAATGCAAAAGVPLTHRDHAQAVTFVTGHGRAGGTAPDWAALARGNHTIVVYMGLATAGETAERLMAAGLAGTTPVAIVEKGTTPEQRVVATTLAEMAGTIRAEGIAAPALLVIGELAARARTGAPAPAELPLAV